MKNLLLQAYESHFKWLVATCDEWLLYRTREITEHFHQYRKFSWTVLAIWHQKVCSSILPHVLEVLGIVDLTIAMGFGKWALKYPFISSPSEIPFMPTEWLLVLAYLQCFQFTLIRQHGRAVPHLTSKAVLSGEQSTTVGTFCFHTGFLSSPRPCVNRKPLACDWWAKDLKFSFYSVSVWQRAPGWCSPKVSLWTTNHTVTLHRDTTLSSGRENLSKKMLLAPTWVSREDTAFFSTVISYTNYLPPPSLYQPASGTYWPASSSLCGLSLL